jgi:ubiquinone/menaquinone biosynthesis C-methylase UbiE
MLPNKKMRVLEIGCADGLFLYTNRNRWKDIVGVDIVDTQIQKARHRKYNRPTRFVLADYGREKMALHSSSFDVCISISTLQYMYDLDLVFEEIHRVLKPGGVWFIEVPNIAVFWRRFELLLGKFPKTSHFENSWDAGVINYFTVPRLKIYCEEKGYRVEKITCSGVFRGLRQRWVGLLGADMIFECRKI